MPNKAIVITSIYPPTKAVLLFSKLKSFAMFVSGDNKTPKGWSHKNVHYLSISDQHKKFPKLSKLVSQNHYARKNFAYLSAILSGIEFLYETDDDNLPYNFFPNFIDSEKNMEEINAPLSFNIYSEFTKKRVWPRGIPLNLIDNKISKRKKNKVIPLIQQSLADLDPDVDAIYRLTNGDVITFAKGKILCLATGTFAPFNSQNTYWSKKVFPLLYLPSTVDSRVCDIWRGYIAQRILWELNSRLIFLSPSVYQKRNVHDYMKDFVQELELYTKTEDLLITLNKIKLKGNIDVMLIDIYSLLIEKGFFKKKELSILREWLRLASQ
ncbi:MAG: hypothetical protein ACD_37C00283G0002 [uncultured bacterium]|nr:MAG: hypothetical protein ACD_37C00283G0002 [uncultured bacterium]